MNEKQKLGYKRVSTVVYLKRLFKNLFSIKYQCDICRSKGKCAECKFRPYSAFRKEGVK